MKKGQWQRKLRVLLSTSRASWIRDAAAKYGLMIRSVYESISDSSKRKKA